MIARGGEVDGRFVVDRDGVARCGGERVVEPVGGGHAQFKWDLGCVAALHGSEGNIVEGGERVGGGGEDLREGG